MNTPDTAMGKGPVNSFGSSGLYALYLIDMPEPESMESTGIILSERSQKFHWTVSPSLTNKYFGEKEPSGNKFTIWVTASCEMTADEITVKRDARIYRIILISFEAT
ncbi:MAG: hypothetical protein GX646_06850 [Bacteroidales bacterium]|nr:hypothetical protein [Bacteroidales bacterium]